MTRSTFLYLVNWLLIFILSTRSGEVLKNRVNIDLLPLWFRARKAKTFAYVGGVIAMGSAVSSVILGLLFMKWYIWPPAILLGMTLAGISFRAFSVAGVLSYCPPFLILAQAVLWLAATSRH